MPDIALLRRRIEEKCGSEEWSEALALLRRLRPLLPRHDADALEFFLYHSGYALLELNRPTRARKRLQELVVLEPTSAHYRLLLADALLRDQEWDAACSQLEAGLTAEPDHPGCLCALGWAFYQRGRVQDGRATLEHALELHPYYFPAHLDLGLIHAAEGRWDASRRHFEAARALAPEDGELQEMLEAVRESEARAQAERRAVRALWPTLRRARAGLTGAEMELVAEVRTFLKKSGAGALERLLAEKLWHDFAGSSRSAPELDREWAAALVWTSQRLHGRRAPRAAVAVRWGVDPDALSRRARGIARSMGTRALQADYCASSESVLDREPPARARRSAAARELARVIPVDFVLGKRLPDSSPCPCGSGHAVGACHHAERGR